MADTSGQADIRGLQIAKAVKGFAEKAFVVKNYVQVNTTGDREVRWYREGVSFNNLLDSQDTSGITASRIANAADGAKPVVAEQSWTRLTSYVQKYFVESPLLSEEDLKDADIGLFARNLRGLVRAVANQVDAKIYDVLTESQSPSDILSTAAAGTGWDDTTNGDPVGDLMTARQKISAQNYDLTGAVAMMNSIEYKHLVNFLIRKGAQFPDTGDSSVMNGEVGKVAGLRVVVTETAVTDSVAVFLPNASATWMSFSGMEHHVIDDPGIGRTIRVLERGVCLLTDPKSVHLTTDTIT